MKFISQLYLSIFFIIPTINMANATPAPASITTYSETNTSANSNMGYGGVKWTLGDSLVPEVVAGYRFASVTNNGATQGGDLSMSIKITGKTELNDLIHLGKLRQQFRAS